jgi:hypothetical protein
MGYILESMFVRHGVAASPVSSRQLTRASVTNLDLQNGTVVRLSAEPGPDCPVDTCGESFWGRIFGRYPDGDYAVRVTCHMVQAEDFGFDCGDTLKVQPDQIMVWNYGGYTHYLSGKVVAEEMA